MDKRHLVRQMRQTAEASGLANITPVIISDGANLLLRLDPYPVVARAAIDAMCAGPRHARCVMARELQVAAHLRTQGIPAVQPASWVHPGPYELEEGTWMTLWQYVPHTALPALAPADAVQAVTDLELAMGRYPGILPELGVWKRASKSADRLRGLSDPKLQSLLELYEHADRRMLKPNLPLIPCHGDAHARNLLSGPDGRVWSDFEDVSLMPSFWDHASYMANMVLFGGEEEPHYLYMLDQTGAAGRSFQFILAARMLMSVVGNLDLALAGHGDLPFALSQLERVEPLARRWL